MKQFIYIVNEFKFVDTIAFGEAWELAKSKATELHVPIYRIVIKNDKLLRHEVFYKGGCFNSIEFMRDDNVKVF